MAINLPTRKLVSQDEASFIERANIPRGRFSCSWGHMTTFDAGYLVPFLVDEVLPGDHMVYNATAYVRMATPLFPLFSNLRIDTFYFYVPNRLLWTNWPKFMGEQLAPNDSIAFTTPTMDSPNGGYESGSIYDHMQLPVEDASVGVATITHTTLPLRAYNLIFNQWFRDQNLVSPAVVNVDDGPDIVADYSLRRRAKAHDYFTSALPWPQKFTAPSVPMGGLAPIVGLGTQATNTETGGPVNAYETSTGIASYANYYAEQYMEAGTDGNPLVFADLSAATGIPINTFRNAFMVQTMLERDARGGTRYVELIRSHFGVTSPDFRLQRPEYIGGGQTPLNITPIAQTAPTDDSVVGALGAAAAGAGNHRASYAATEHGIIIGIINIRSELTYQQGLHKMWSRFTRYDHYDPAFAGLGEQAILRKEIYALGTAADLNVFGYQERWHEYRTRYNEVSGLFRSQTGQLDMWHLGQYFQTPPTLNDVFIADDPPMTRVLAAAELAVGQQFLADIHISRVATRPIPTYGTPAILGRF